MIVVGASTLRAASVYTNGFALDAGDAVMGLWYLSAYTQPNLGGNIANFTVISDTNKMLYPWSAWGVPGIWYGVNQGSLLNANYVSIGTPFANSWDYGTYGSIPLTIGVPFILGFWLDANGDAAPDDGDRYGWAKLKPITYPSPVGISLTLVSSAITDSPYGIFAGTTTTAPEPSSAALMALVLLPAGLRRWRSRLPAHRPARHGPPLPGRQPTL